MKTHDPGSVKISELVSRDVSWILAHVWWTVYLSTVRLSICPSVHLSICPPVHLSICPPVHLSTCPSVHLSICPPVHLSDRQTVFTARRADDCGVGTQDDTSLKSKTALSPDTLLTAGSGAI